MTLTNYVAIDFETANSNYGSPCSVGLVRVRNGVPVDERQWLIKPPASIGHFDEFNIGIHGITPAMVEYAPPWRAILSTLVEYVGNDVLVAHNARFDMSVIHYACEADGLPTPAFRSCDTIRLAKQVLPLYSYRLTNVAKEVGVTMHHHHDALSDARTVVGIVAALADWPDLIAFPRSMEEVVRPESGFAKSE